MKATLILLLTAALVLTAKASPLSGVPDDSDTDAAHPTTPPNLQHNISLTRYTAMVERLVGAMQTTWTVLTEHVRKSCCNS